MAGRIPRLFIDEVVARADIVDTIDSYVSLRKAGKDYQACCPFHQEKTPSFSVSREKQFYYCFGCGASGNVISFLMEYAQLDFVEAIEELSSRLGLDVPYETSEQAEEESGEQQQAQQIYQVLEQAAAFYQQQLQQHPEAARAQEYLALRGLNAEVQAQFGIGYAPSGWDSLIRHLARDARQMALLAAAGLVSEKDNGRVYDRFRERVMFPIHDQRGRVIAFGGRVLDAGEPKYLNSPETSVFQKRRELYGWYQARKTRPSPQSVVVVEGYMDVLALVQHEVPNAVATLGTATGEEHLQRLFRGLSEVVFCFDGDNAGRRAAWRGLEAALPLLEAGRQVRFMFLPTGEDPDSLVRSGGKNAFLSYLEQALPLSQFLFEQLCAQVNMQSLDGRARLVELARPLLEKLPEGPYRELMLQELSQRSGVSHSSLEHMLPEPSAGRVQISKPRYGKPANKPITPSPMRKSVALIVQFPQLAQSLPEDWQGIDTEQPGASLLLALLDFARDNPHVTTGSILEHWRDSEHEPVLKKLALWDLLIPEEGLIAEFQDALRCLQQQGREQRLETLLQKARFGMQNLSAEEKQAFYQLTSRSPQQKP